MCPAEDPTSTPAQRRSATVLVVETEVLIRLNIAEYLREHDINVIEAASAQEARAVFEAGISVDVLFSDVSLSASEDGCDLALWAAKEYPGIALLLTSGVAHGSCDARDAHVTFVTKPYMPEKILALVLGKLARRAQS
jgi:DNA-binding NtrC family response regulator